MSNELTVFDKFKADLAAFKEHNAELSFDFAIPEEEEACRVHHRKLRKLWNGVEKLKLKTTAVLREEVADTNTEAKAIQSQVDDMANPFKAQMDAKDAELQKAIDDLAEKNRLQAEYDEDERLAWLEYRELQAQAIIDEADRKEAAAQKLLNDAEIQRKATEATAKAVEAVKRKAEIDKINAKTLADKKVADATFEANRKAHKAKNDLLAKQLQEKNEKVAEEERLAGIEADRVADSEHRKEIEGKIVDNMKVLIATCSDLNPEDMAQEIVDAITSLKILNIQIIY